MVHSMSGITIPFANVCILGAAGGVGQPLSLLMKMHPLVKRLHLFDVAPTKGVAVDVSHINTSAEVHTFQGPDNLSKALEGSDIVVCVAGVTLKPGQTRDDLFDINARIIKGLMETAADSCPNAFIAVVSNPVNSLTPLAIEVFKKKGVVGAEKRIFGVTTLDVIRANTFAAPLAKADVTHMSVPVIGAHEGITIIPVISQAHPEVTFKSEEKLKQFVNKIMYAGMEVLEAKDGKGTATLSMAYAAARFTQSLLLAKTGHPTVECTYVHSNITDVDFFANRVLIGKEGVEKNYGLGSLTALESEYVKAAVEKLKTDIQKGKDAVHKHH